MQNFTNSTNNNAPQGGVSAQNSNPVPPANTNSTGDVGNTAAPKTDFTHQQYPVNLESKGPQKSKTPFIFVCILFAFIILGSFLYIGLQLFGDDLEEGESETVELIEPMEEEIEVVEEVSQPSLSGELDVLAVPEEYKERLIANGIDTIEKLMKASVEELLSIFSEEEFEILQIGMMDIPMEYIDSMLEEDAYEQEQGIDEEQEIEEEQETGPIM